MTNINTARRNNLLFLGMIVSMAFWGGSWVSAKLISVSLAPEMTAFWRFFTQSIAFLLVMLFTRRSFALSLRAALWLLAGGLVLGVYNIFFFLGLQVGGLAGKSGVIVTTLNPIFAFVISAIVFHTGVRRLQIVGLFLGLSGGFLLMDPVRLFSGGGIDPIGLLFVGAALLWAVLTNISKEIRRDLDIYQFSFYLYAIASLMLAGFAMLRGNFILPGSGAVTGTGPGTGGYTAGFWINVLYLGIPAGVFANSMYFTAVHELGAHRGASFTFMVPATAVLSSLLILGEVPQVLTIIGGTLAVFAVYIIARMGVSVSSD